jgi:DNA-binding transcriptional ArsR family regulator
MSDDHRLPPRTTLRSPDYDLADVVDGTTVERCRALGDPVRQLLLDLVLERAMTVTELAERVGRAKGTIAHHVDVLVGAGLLQIVRTRKVRALEERFYGRVARTITMPPPPEGQLPFVAEATAEADFARMTDASSTCGFTLRHARIPAARASEYIDRLNELALEFHAEARGGDVEFAMFVGVFPTIRPVVPARRRTRSAS